MSKSPTSSSLNSAAVHNRWWRENGFRREDAMTPGQIRQIRKDLSLSQQKFANELGVALSTVFRWEKGDSKPKGLSLQALERLAKQAASRRREAGHR